MIASHYCLHYTTVELFASSLTARTKLRGLINIVAAASEFARLPVRHGEESSLQRMAMHARHKVENKEVAHSKVRRPPRRAAPAAAVAAEAPSYQPRRQPLGSPACAALAPPSGRA